MAVGPGAGGRTRQLRTGSHSQLALGTPWQDADAAYKVKVELEAKVDSLDKDIKFLKCLYEAVRPLLLSIHSAPTCFWHTLPGGGLREGLRAPK